MNIKRLIFYGILLVTIGCKQENEKILYQFSTIESLMAGNYDGQFPVMKINSYGDFGIGTFDKLDGEMILLHGTVYKAKSDGTVTSDVLSETTPFASVCNFNATQTIDINGIASVKELDSIIGLNIPHKNMIYAITVSTLFDSISYRSVSKQRKPYKPLIDVVKYQSVFIQPDIEGTLVGYYYPTSVKDICVKGLHIHFISSDFRKGGHVMSLHSSRKATVRIAELKGMYLEFGSHQTNKVSPVDHSALRKIEN